MVAEALALIGIYLLTFVFMVTGYVWIMAKLNGQTSNEYLDNLVNKLNEAEKQAKLNPVPWYVRIYYRLKYYLFGAIISLSLFYVIDYL